MEENPKQKYRLKIRREKGKPRRQALMAECKMMRPNMWKLQQNQHLKEQWNQSQHQKKQEKKSNRHLKKIHQKEKKLKKLIQHNLLQLQNLKMVRKKTL
ncbi:hypothetical protein [Neisseria meningitidis]|uniref:hypothetical protein n=1 Tax=Neisseria meningitidis TaxID=487 RepID=UPI00046DD5CA|nr:hypothetical protein [Neisseria meningitidis]